ncbi:CHRD superfamily protein [Colletotrichum truncatum]|uniref:CHRD superfamily protein n=1 Tax=Colletotrichum truncatum TaxID=5467 RepID=A0ACC3ZHC0_COLTU|nr:CHRD superfamily protein [Colletotrichum truncatum]KAF6790658.1 CHRD superfamily protein [Colletotrichum truncatum]
MKFSIIPVVMAVTVAATPIKIIEDVTHLIGWHKKADNKQAWGTSGPFHFTSSYHIVATPDQVVDNNNTATGGLAGAIGYYSYGINSWEDVICYNITLVNFQGEYQSPALTATHIHEAPKGRAGPPRIAFPNPKPVPGSANIRRSVGCLSGPFRTGVNVTGTQTDTGEGFAVRRIEEDPSKFFTDVHSSLAVPGAVRGQLDEYVNRNCN